MSTITKEQIEQYANAARLIQVSDFDKGKLITVAPDHMLELARIALASLEAEAVHQVFDESGGWFDVDSGDVTGEIEDRNIVRVLFTAPPAPIVPDEIQKLKDGREFKYVKDGVHYSVNYANGWNACRAAMLQGAEPVTTGYKLDGGENCWSCGMYFTYEQHSECDGYCPHCDSPVDLDDDEEGQSSKVVPLEPTDEMISNAWREAIGKCDHETIKRIWLAMLAAAPQQEAE